MQLLQLQLQLDLERGERRAINNIVDLTAEWYILRLAGASLGAVALARLVDGDGDDLRQHPRVIISHRILGSTKGPSLTFCMMLCVRMDRASYSNVGGLENEFSMGMGDFIPFLTPILCCLYVLVKVMSCRSILEIRVAAMVWSILAPTRSTEYGIPCSVGWP